MKKILIVCGEPFVSEPGINMSVVTMLKQQMPDAQLDILGSLYPDFHMDVEAEQKKLLDADLIILQSPIYWYSPSALTRAWFEQVLAFGWAYGSAHALEGKKVILGLTAGGSAASYTPGKECVIAASEMLKPVELVFDYCKMNVLGTVFSPDASSYIGEEKAKALCENHVSQIMDLVPDDLKN